jgi:hypothetical protein
MLLAQHAASDPVAFGASGVRTAAEFLRDAAAVADALPEPPQAALALLAIRSDRYAFAVALVGAWARGYDVGLAPPQVTREDFLQLAQQPEVSAVLHDTLSAAPLRIDQVLATAKSDGSLSSQQLAQDGVLRFVHWHAQARQLREIERVSRVALCEETLTLARRHRFPPQAACIASVSPDTRYGLMFSCLWPLLTGGEFWRDDPRTHGWATGLPEPSSAVERKVVVSVPAHVRMLLQAPSQPLDQASTLVCAGSALPREARVKLAQLPRLSVCDLYASEQLDERATFGASDYADDIQAAAARLELEETIAWLPGLVDAALLPVRVRVRVPVPTDESAAPQYQLAVVAPGLPESTVRERVAERCPNVTLTRVLVFDAHALPPQAANASFSGGRRGMRRGSTGVHDYAGLLRLFGYRADGERLSFELAVTPHEPAVQAVDGARPGEVVFDVHVPANYGYFAGHFPGQPILPGAAQLSELVLPCVRRARPELGRLVRLTRLKFQERILPDDRVVVALVFGSDPRQVDFALRRATTICAAGRLNFELQAGGLGGVSAS